MSDSSKKAPLPKAELPFPEIERNIPRTDTEVRALIKRVKKSFEKQLAEEQKERNDRDRRSDYSSRYVL